MDAPLKKILRALSLDLRHTLEGSYKEDGTWNAGDLERRLNQIGIWRDRPGKPISEMPNLSPVDRKARELIDAYLSLRREAGVTQSDAVAEFIRESAYSWANRLFALRCMEARGIIDPVILLEETYGGRSMVHNRFAQRNPALCTGEDDGLFEMLSEEFKDRSHELPDLFELDSPAVALRPSVAALKKCVALLSGSVPANGGRATDEVFTAPDAFGWAYQYWNAEEKDRVFEMVRTKKGAKIEGSDIIPATQLYTEPYMVKFLVQNSLGATWMMMHPESKLSVAWEYYVKDADRTPNEKKPVAEITFLDPACGSGHFLIEAFDLLYAMYEEEGQLKNPAAICQSILNNNLFGIDIDERAVQITKAVLWMKAAETVFAKTKQQLAGDGLSEFHEHIIATNIRLPNGKDHLDSFLKKHPEDAPLRPALLTVFEGLQNVHELGSLVQIEEPVEKELKVLKEQAKQQKFDPESGEVVEKVNFPRWKQQVMKRLKAHFQDEAEKALPTEVFFSQSAVKGLALFDLLARRYDIVAANPPYMHNRNVGRSIREYLNYHFPVSFMDLYTSFIERCTSLVKDNAQVAMVSQQSFMFLSTYSKLRKKLLNNGHLRIVAHLGSRAFSEISGEKVNIVLLIYQTKTKKPILSLFLDLKNSSEKKVDLLKIIKNVQSENYFKINQSSFDAISDSPFIYWIDAPIREYLKRPCLDSGKENSPTIIKGGISTTDNERFLRFFWETNNLRRWYNYRKGGSFCRWYGNSQYYVDWEGEGLRLKTLVTENHGNPGKHLRNMQFFNRDGLTYSLMCGNGFSVRYFPKNSKFDNSGPGIFPNRLSIDVLAVYLNSALVRYITKLFNPTMSVQSGDVGKLPLPIIDESLIKKSKIISQICLKSKIALLSNNPIEDVFISSKMNNKIELENELILTFYNHLIDILILKTQNFDLNEIPQYLKSKGYPVLTYPLIDGKYSTYPQLFEFNQIQTEFKDYVKLNKLVILNNAEILQIKLRLKKLFENGILINNDIRQSNEENIDGDFLSKSEENSINLSNFYECLIEMLSIKLEIHPLSIYWLMKEGIENEGWRCIPEEKRRIEDLFMVMVLRLLGHRWPKQIEAGEPLPKWADADGIIPITSGLTHPTLLQQIRDRIAAEFPEGNVHEIEKEFEEVVGMSLERWLAGEFFKNHISQFKKRPIAWQLSSSPSGNGAGNDKGWGSRSEPAFSCLVYYHKIDADILHKIRTQYVGDLINRYGTELRSLGGRKELTEDQASRKVQLENWIVELKDFSQALQDVADNGFESTMLREILKKEFLDKWTSRDGKSSHPRSGEEFYAQENRYDPDINDGVRVNIAPLQKAGLLSAEVIAKKDVEKAIEDRAEWRADERRWCREGKLPKCGWWEIK